MASGLTPAKIKKLEKKYGDIGEFVNYVGYTWTRDERRDFKMPERTLGVFVILWIMQHLQDEEGNPFRPTPEQSRFILWFYAINGRGRWVYTSGVLQRLKGHGKDIILAAMALAEMLGPCRFDGWDEKGNAKAKTCPSAWVQVVAVSQDQTRNTFKVFDWIIKDETIKKYRLEVNKFSVNGAGGRTIEGLSKRPRKAEGNRVTFAIFNEPHHYLSADEQGMFTTVTGNITKRRGQGAHWCAISNAPDANENSSLMQTRETYDGQIEEYGFSSIYYDSIEAKQDAPADDPDFIIALLELLRGDSFWLDAEGISEDFFDLQYSEERNRRMFYNQIVKSNTSWVAVQDWSECFRRTPENIRITKKDEIVLGLDCSKSDDTTVLIGCRVSDGYVFRLGFWGKPPKRGDLSENWLVPRTPADPNPYGLETVSECVDKAFKEYNVVAFFADPSHAKGDTDGRQYWKPVIDSFHQKYKDTLKLWAGPKTGRGTHSIWWDMSEPLNTEEFAKHAELTKAEIMDFTVLHDGDPEIKNHVRNAKIYNTRQGFQSIWKGEDRTNKIDAAVCMILARMVRAKYLNQFGIKKAPPRSLRSALYYS